jgi:adenosylhomocysteine nucleosidase
MHAPSVVLIVTALPEERDAIASRAHDVRFNHSGYVDAFIRDAEVAISATGDGAKAAEEGAGELCDALRPVALIGAGVAGALTPSLRLGDLVVGRRIRDSRGEAPPPNPGFVDRGVRAGALAGTLVTIERPAVGPSEKAALAVALDGEGPGAADMESAAWARAAANRGIPYLVVRSISDTADEEIPSYLARCVGADGRIRRAAVLGYSLTRPGTIPALLRMRKRMQACGEGLASFLDRFFTATP